MILSYIILSGFFCFLMGAVWSKTGFLNITIKAMFDVLAIFAIAILIGFFYPDAPTIGGAKLW